MADAVRFFSRMDHDSQITWQHVLAWDALNGRTHDHVAGDRVVSTTGYVGTHKPCSI